MRLPDGISEVVVTFKSPKNVRNVSGRNAHDCKDIVEVVETKFLFIISVELR